MDVEEIKRSFTRHFSELGYSSMPSMSLVIPELSTTFVLSVGLLQLKAVLTPHADKQDFPDFCMVQRCLRQFDIERSGDANHLCFFEMAGAISSGTKSHLDVLGSVIDYLTGPVGLEKDRLVFTTFGGGEFEGRMIAADVQSEEALAKLDITSSKTMRFGVETNFFGNTLRDVAYGPSVEVYVDRGAQGDAAQHDCLPGCPCQRFVEVGTCVFLQYLRHDGQFVEMPRVFCEAGIGVERLAFVSSGLQSIHELPTLGQIANTLLDGDLLDDAEGTDRQADAAICSDYFRAALFAMADGARPGGDGGRAHVMRVLMRRLLVRLRYKNEALKQELPAIARRVADLNRHVIELPESTLLTVCEVMASELALFERHLQSGTISAERYRRKPAK